MKAEKVHFDRIYFVLYPLILLILLDFLALFLVPYNIVRYILFILLCVSFSTLLLKILKLKRWLKILILLTALAFELALFFLQVSSSICMLQGMPVDLFEVMPMNFIISILMWQPFSIIYGCAKYSNIFSKSRFTFIKFAKVFMLSLSVPMMIPAFVFQTKILGPCLINPNDVPYFLVRNGSIIVIGIIIALNLFLFSKKWATKIINLTLVVIVIFVTFIFSFLSGLIIEIASIYCLFFSLKCS